MKKDCGACATQLLNPGELRHTIYLQGYTDTQDSVGQPIRSYSTLATVRARVEPLRGREFQGTQRQMGETTTRITMWYRPGMSRTMRILFEGVFYNIEAIIDVNMEHRVLELMCSSGLGDEA